MYLNLFPPLGVQKVFIPSVCLPSLFLCTLLDDDHLWSILDLTMKMWVTNEFSNNLDRISAPQLRFFSHWTTFRVENVSSHGDFSALPATTRAWEGINDL